MQYVKRAWSWLREHWYVPLFVVGVLLGFVVSSKTRRKGPPPEQVKAELEVIKAGARAKALEVELGAEKAAAAVEEAYRAETERMDAQEREKAQELRQDPRALARYLARAGRKPR